jgi:pyruvate kinase
MTKDCGDAGPKSRSVDTISVCLKAGMSGNNYCPLPLPLDLNLSLISLSCCSYGTLPVAWFDFSWGDTAYHHEMLENLKLAIKSTKMLCTVSGCCSGYTQLLPGGSLAGE